MRGHQQKMISLICAVVFLTGCSFFASAPKEGEQGLRGTWKYKDSYQGNQALSFRKGGDYAFDFDGDGTQEVWGHYELEWNQIKFTDIGGKIVNDCRGTGIYGYTLSAHELKFTLVSDSCSSRIKSLSFLWVRKKG